MGQRMVDNKIYAPIQQIICRWLHSSNKSQVIEVEQEKVVLGSALGRRSENQDRVLFCRVRFEESRKPAFAVLVLCDGMGGMVSGGDCANLAISTFVASLVHSNTSTLTEKLGVAVRDANESVYAAYKGKGGSTLSAIICDQTDQWAAINVGDSRIYQVLNNGQMKQLSTDDTLENQLADLNLPSPPPEFRQLLQYIGMGKGIELREIELKPSSDVKWIVITSDGAHDIPKDIFQSIVAHAKTAQDTVTRLISLSEWLGGRDNSTVAVLPYDKNLLLHEEECSLGSLEIWGMPGKVELFSVKILPEAFQHNTLTKFEPETIQRQDDIKNQESLSAKKQPKRKKQKNIETPELTDEVSGSSNVEKTVPQVNIEFSEEF